MGDYADLVLRQDVKRFTGTCVKEELLGIMDSMINAQTREIIKTFKPLADAGRLLGLLEGNHEQSIKKHHSFDVLREVCQTLNVPNLGFSCFYRLTLKHNTKSQATRNCVIYAHHGYGGGRKPGASINKMVDALTSFDCDVMLMGHDHQKLGKRYIRLGITQNGTPRLVKKSTVLARTGTFLKTCIEGDTTYSEQFGYPPNDMGVVRIDLRFTGKEKELDIHVSE